MVMMLYEAVMKKCVCRRRILCWSAVWAVCFLVPVPGNSATNGVIAVLGSSVAKGVDTTGSGMVGGSHAWGYAGLLTTCLDPQGWAVTNLSSSSDTTTNMLDIFDAAVVPIDPDQLVIGLSLADSGLVGATNPAAVAESFQTTLTNVIGHARDNGMYAMTGLCYPNNSYSTSEYARVKAMNLQINTYDLPSANFLGAIDDGEGHWVEGYASDAGHPNVFGHEEMFYTIVPSLFDAVRLGKTERPVSLKNDNGYYAVVTRDAAVHDPIRFTPDETVHSFTTAFRVRSACTGTVAAVMAEENPLSLHEADRILVDFGPDDSDRGHITLSPDQNGHYWNNFSGSYSNAVPAGADLSDLVRTSGTTSQVALVVTTAFSAPNGGNSWGGLMTPDPALLGDLAVTNATEDYFCTGGTSKFKITGLDKRFFYTLRFFGTRVMEGSTRTTRYTATGNGNTYATNMVTTGTNVGTGGYAGNNDTVAELHGLLPDANGAIEVGVTLVSGFAYLSIMEIRVEKIAPLALSDRMLIDFGPNNDSIGHAAPSPDQNGNYWNSWRYAQNSEWAIPVGASLPNLVKTSGVVSPVELVVTEPFGAPNGGTSYGGLTVPDPALLGDFAVTNATEDYFGISGTSKFKIKGLDNQFTYTLRFFGSRVMAGDTRKTSYAATGGNGTYATNLVTTGTDVGTGGYAGNNDTIAELSGLTTDANGEIEVTVKNLSGYGYLNIMEIDITGTSGETDPDSLLIDFGPNDGVNGNAMSSPDSNGRYWNNFVPPINAGRILTNMIDSISAKTTTVSLAITKAFVSYNGINTGGLLAPAPALLGYFAQTNATEDFFHTQATGSGLMISGLNRSSVYTLRFFGTRILDTGTFRTTRFTVEGGNGSYSTNMVTTGTGVGTEHNGNDDTIPELTGIVPNAHGCVTVGVSNVEGNECYLSIMEIKKERSVAGTGWSAVELRTNALVYVASTGIEIKAPITLDDHWHDVAVSHCYAGQVTRFFVDGTEIGYLPERLAPTAFILGGEGVAGTNRIEGPQVACYQNWCVYRSAWNAEEAVAQAAGAMQQASMEICAALADSHFVQGGAVYNRAQSLSEAIVNSSQVKQKPIGTAIMVR